MPSSKKQHFLQVFEIKDLFFYLVKFTNISHKLSDNYSYKVLVFVNIEEPLYENLNGKSARIVIYGETILYIHGVISECTYIKMSTDGKHFYEIILHSFLNKLKTMNSRVFQKQNTLQIVESILNEANWTKKDYLIKTTKNYQEHEFLIQLEETDLSFIETILSQSGLFYTFVQEEGRAILLIFDDIKNISESIDLEYKDEIASNRIKNSIYYFVEYKKLLSNNFILNNYNYEKPEQDLKVRTENNTGIFGYGTCHMYGVNYKNLADGKEIASVYQKATDCMRQIFIAKTDCINLKVGQKLSLKKHPISYLNTEYRIIEINLCIDQSGIQSETKNEVINTSSDVKLTLIRESLPFCTYPAGFSKKYGIIQGEIESPKKYAHLDEMGRYRVRLFFDKRVIARGLASCPIRAMQITDGMHFPLPDGTKVAVGFIEGDVKQPVILGVINDEKYPSVVNCHNPSQNIISSKSGNEIIMDDLENEELIRISTREKENQIQLNSKQNNSNINMESMKGEIKILAKNNINIETGNNYIAKAKKSITKIKGKIKLSSSKINLESKRKILSSAKEINLNAKKCSIKTNQFEGESKTSSFKSKNMRIISKNMKINSKKIIVYGNENAKIDIKNGDYGITITEKEIKIKGRKIRLSAETINIFKKSKLN